MRSASVTGAPSARKIGAIMLSTMCWTMWTEISTVSYAASADWVASTIAPRPAPTNQNVRQPDHRSPRARSRRTAPRYQAAASPTPIAGSGSNDHSVSSVVQVSGGGRSPGPAWASRPVSTISA